MNKNIRGYKPLVKQLNNAYLKKKSITKLKKTGFLFCYMRILFRVFYMICVALHQYTVLTNKVLMFPHYFPGTSVVAPQILIVRGKAVVAYFRVRNWIVLITKIFHL